jgi:LmbE family N-acetylglucosaminyl deacetylase
MSPSVQPRQVSTGRARPVLPSGVLPSGVLSRRLRPGRIAGVGRAARRVIARPSAASPIDAAGTSETAWRAWAELARLPVADIASWTSAVIVAPHPDDEVLGAGGIICQLAAAGARLRVIAVTDGEAAYPDETDLAQRRAQERSAALRALGAGEAEVVRLGLPDSGLAGRERDIAKRIGELVTGFDVCLAPWEKDAHADHEAVGRAARQASGRAFFYPVWMWHWAAPADSRVPWRQAVRVPLPPAVASRKEAAISCFRSQLEITDPVLGPVLSADFVSHFTRGYEVLLPVTRP